MNHEKKTQVWMSDLVGIIPSITGKVELVYEGEQEGPYQVAMNLVDKAIRTAFTDYFPNPDGLKKRRNTGKPSQGEKESENPYKPVTAWFDKGNHLNLSFSTSDKDKLIQLYTVDGLHALVKKFFPQANDMQSALLMEFVLHGLSSYSLISKKIFESNIEFKDLIGSMMDLGETGFGEEFDEEA